ncbi:hypothetical protein PENTCL1PPCAC_28445 [Pristionchus entomophagus]|uniref:Uncharacterized protein n=1 Tax=Pristionchus entomophagus TaxID=358040 RepID=A0AAV5UGZ5_9BILA|nr:hypothetical protein PENTCL1PPCAC_28445 [Pristionchus entomophagus]
MSNVTEQLGNAVEQAKEAAGKVTEQLSDFFQGNPFTTPVGIKIEQATDASVLATENWGLNMEIVDFINYSEEGGRDAIRAIRKRLHTQMTKNNSIVMYTLTVLETCVKNGNHRFHVLACNKEFILDLVKLIGPKFDAPQIIQERVLSLIQAWADAFKGQPDLAGVVQVYDDLRSKGVEFPPTDLDTLAPIITPKRTVFTAPPPVVQAPPPAQHAQQPLMSTVPSEVMNLERSMPIDPSEEQMAKMRKDIDVVNVNLKVLREMLTEITPGKDTAEELELIKEIHQSTKTMQQRVLELIRVIANEQVTFELLVVNDEFNAVFDKYDRWMANREGGGNPGGDLIDMNSDSLANQLNSLGVSQAKPSSSQSAYSANKEGQSSLGLAAAAAQRTEELPSDAQAAEMEAWLKESGEKRQSKSTARPNPENDGL